MIKLWWSRVIVTRCNQNFKFGPFHHFSSPSLSIYFPCSKKFTATRVRVNYIFSYMQKPWIQFLASSSCVIFAPFPSFEKATNNIFCIKLYQHIVLWCFDLVWNGGDLSFRKACSEISFTYKNNILSHYY